MNFVNRNICKILIIPSIIIFFINLRIFNFSSFNTVYNYIRGYSFYSTSTVYYNIFYFSLMLILIAISTYLLYSFRNSNIFILSILFLFVTSFINFLSYGIVLSYMEQILNYNLHDDIQGLQTVFYSLLLIPCYYIYNS